MSLLRTACLILLSTVAALGADISGPWTGTLAMPNGGDGFVISYSFKQEGAKLTGTVAGPQGDSIAISDGKVEGDKLTFTVTFNGTVFKHEGVISGEEIKLTMKADAGDLPGGTFVLKRVKA